LNDGKSPSLLIDRAGRLHGGLEQFHNGGAIYLFQLSRQMILLVDACCFRLTLESATAV
jgi:hypothetical protein